MKSVCTAQAAALFASAFLILLTAAPLPGQWADLSGWNGNLIPDENGGSKLKLDFEMRSRYDVREGEQFGKKPDRDVLFTRLRVGMSYPAFSI